MNFHVGFTEMAKRELEKLDKYTNSMLLGWVKKNLEGCQNPRQHGKALTANRSGQWRYRIGDYRMIAEIQDSEVLILILSVGLRRDRY
ncbi:MAG: type II toxin-antitoxin system RelE/ParE family toxin [Clostridiales bacterium]|nr:type II toxin-antitoxin system RelE/ParE family toxin [Clostridiales bacterium]